MAVNVEELVVKFSADITGLRTNLERVEKSFRDVDKTVAQTSGTMSSQIAGLGRLFKLDLVVRYGTQLLRLEDQMEQLASTIKDTSDRADLSAESLQRLRHVADQNGTSAEAMDSALIRLNKAMGLARLGAEGMGEMFDALGLGELIDKGATTEDVFYGMADAVRSMKDESQASAIVAKIMGREADRLIETFKLGGDEAERLGHTLRGVISQETIDKLDAARDRTEEYKKVIASIGAVASEVFTDLVLLIGNVGSEMEKQIGLGTKLAEIYAAFRDFGSGPLAESFGAAPSVPAASGQRQAPARGRALAPARSRLAGAVDEGKLRTLLGGGSGGSGSSAVSEIERQQRAVEELIADLQFEISVMGQSAEQQAVMEALRRAGTGATEAQRVQIEAYTRSIFQNEQQLQATAELESFADGIRRQFGDGTAELVEFQTQLNEAFAQGKVTLEEYTAAMEDAIKTDQVKELEATWRQIGETIEGDIADAFVDMTLNMENARETIGNLIEDIGRLIAKQLILQAIQGVTSSIFGGGAGLFGGSAAGVGGSVGGAGISFGGFAAGGGPVDAGRAYVVGEKGPELIVPRVPGNVIPNNRLGGGGGDVVINSSFNVAPGVNKQELMLALAGYEERVTRRIVPMVRDANARGALKLH